MKVSPGAVKRILIQFLLRSCGRWRSPEDWQRSPPPSWSAPPHSPACPCPQCSDLERSCWQRPLYQRQGCLVGKVVCMFHTESESIISMKSLIYKAHLINDWRLQIHEHRSGNILAIASVIVEGGVVRVVAGVNTLTIRTHPMLHPIQLPAGWSYLTARLAQVDADTFSCHCPQNSAMCVRSR